MDDELNMDPRETDHFDDFDMNPLINIQELKTRLKQQGFTDPEWAAQLDDALPNREWPLDHLTLKKNVSGETLDSYIDLEKDQDGWVTLGVMDMAITVEGNIEDLRWQYFQPDVSFNEALQLLTERSKYPEGLEHEVRTPMSAATVAERLKAYALPVAVAEIKERLAGELARTGITGPSLLHELEQHIRDRERYFFLRHEITGDGADFRYHFHFRPDEAGELRFDYYHGYNWPQDPKAQEAIYTGLDNFNRGQNFETDVPVRLATQLLQSRIALREMETLEHLKPLSGQAVRALLTVNIKQMNTENLSYLQKQLLNLGFGDKLNEELEKNLKGSKKEFTLKTDMEYNKQPVDYTLHFKAGDDRAFLNKYDASLRDKDMNQTFYINKSGAITAKEAFNLLEGRAVHKQLENLEGEKYYAWIIIDKENKTENGNYKLRPFTNGWNYRPERAIDKLDIVGIGEEGARDKLLKSLEKGNRHQVTAMKDGKEVKLFLEANPAEHRVNLTNWKGESQQLEHYKKPELKKEQNQAQSQEDAPAKKSKKSAKMKV